MEASDFCDRDLDPVDGAGDLDGGVLQRFAPFQGHLACEVLGLIPYQLREVLPYAPDAWYNPNSVKIGYEISFNRYFYKPKALRPLEEIRSDLLAVEQEAEGLLEDLLGVER